MKTIVPESYYTAVAAPLRKGSALTNTKSKRARDNFCCEAEAKTRVCLSKAARTPPASCAGSAILLNALTILRRRANELARSGDAGVGALCRFTHASGPHPLRIHSGRTGMYRVLIYHLIHHSCMHHSCMHPSISRPKFNSFWTSASRPISTFSPALSACGAHRPPRLGHERTADGLFSSPPPIPYSVSSLCSRPVPGRASGCHGFSPHQATWPTVQFRQLTNPGSPGFRQSLGAD